MCVSKMSNMAGLTCFAQFKTEHWFGTVYLLGLFPNARACMVPFSNWSFYKRYPQKPLDILANETKIVQPFICTPTRNG